MENTYICDLWAKRRILRSYSMCYRHFLRSSRVFYSCPHLPTWLVTVNDVTARTLHEPPSMDSRFLPLRFTSFWPLKKLRLASDLQQTPTLNVWLQPLYSNFLYNATQTFVDCVWNVMAHAQEPDFVFRRNGRVHLNRRERQFIRLLATEVCASAVVMLDTPYSEVVWRVLATHSIRQYPLHFSSCASPCAITFQLDSATVGQTVKCQFPLRGVLEFTICCPYAMPT
jgi:hypothetical protein